MIFSVFKISDEKQQDCSQNASCEFFFKILKSYDKEENQRYIWFTSFPMDIDRVFQLTKQLEKEEKPGKHSKRWQRSVENSSVHFNNKKQKSPFNSQNKTSICI